MITVFSHISYLTFPALGFTYHFIIHEIRPFHNSSIIFTTLNSLCKLCHIFLQLFFQKVMSILWSTCLGTDPCRLPCVLGFFCHKMWWLIPASYFLLISYLTILEPFLSSYSSLLAPTAWDETLSKAFPFRRSLPYCFQCCTRSPDLALQTAKND